MCSLKSYSAGPEKKSKNNFNKMFKKTVIKYVVSKVAGV